MITQKLIGVVAIATLFAEGTMPKKKDDKAPVAEERFQHVEVSAKDPRTVVLMLDSPEPAIVCKACQALQQHVEKAEQNCIDMKEHGVVQKLVALLDKDKAVCSYALLCLAAMTNKIEVKRVLLKVDCIPPLLAQLKPDVEVILQERASYTVAQLAEEYSFKIRLNEQCAHKNLLQLLPSADVDIQKNSIKSLSLLTQHHQVRRLLAEEKAFSTILPLLESEYPEIQEHTLHTLENCLRDAECRTEFSEAGGLAKLTAFLVNLDWSDLHLLAVSVMSLCLLADGGMEALHSSDCLQKFLLGIKDSTLPSVQAKAATALAKAARNMVSCKILHEENAEKVLIDLLAAQDDEVLCAAADAISSMAALTSSKQTIGAEGGISSLVNLLQHVSERVRATAVTGLAATLIEAQGNCIAVGENGGIELLVALLGDDDATCRCGAAKCLINMGPNASLRYDLVEAGAMSALANSLSYSDSSVQHATAGALAVLGCDNTARVKFPDEGVSQLMNLLHSTNTSLCRNAAWALSTLAKSDNVAEAVFKKRGLKFLQKLCQSSENREVAQYAGLALRTLLAENLSAKYALTGLLTAQDKLIETEFCDTGMARSAEDFVPLVELLEKQLSLSRPIFTVSLVALPPPPVLHPPVVVTDDAATNKDGSQIDLQASHKSKSRSGTAQQDGSKTSSGTGKGKKHKGERHTDSRMSEESGDSGDHQQLQQQQQQQSQGSHLLQPDADLREHIEHVKNNFQPLNTVIEQVKETAIYVSDKMGGQIHQTDSFHHHLELGELQASADSNIVPLGSVKKGSYQHRTLLFKVLADHLGINCTLERGTYGHYWNTVMLVNECGQTRQYVVDLVRVPGELLSENSHQAQRYKGAH